jgi:hypothetical protein
VEKSKHSARALYGRLVADRDNFLREAYESALLTIPALVPDSNDARQQGTHSTMDLPKPWQSLGARGVNNLGSKLILTLLPPSGSFGKYQIDPKIFAEMDPAEVDAVKTDLEQRLAARERAIVDDVNASNIRTKAFLAAKHLLVSGNYLLYLPPTGGARGFPLNQYVCRRDFTGNVLELIYVQILDRDSVEPKVRDLLDEDVACDDEGRDKPVEVYTHVWLDNGRFHSHQEVDDKIVPGTVGSVKEGDSPWMVLRWAAIDGEDYGRGFVEDYRGDLRSLEELSKALVKAALNAAKLIPIISPQSTLTPQDLVDKENGEPLIANPGDLTMFQQEKTADMSVARAQRQDLEQSLAADFLMNQSIQRNAERVTAEEIRLMAQELENTLGGVYSVLTQEFQLPLFRRVEAQMVKRGSLKRLPPEAAKVSIVTGLAAIGRGQDLQRLQEGVGMIAQMAQAFPELAQRINAADLAKRIFIGVGVDTTGLLKTEEQIAAEQQQVAQQQQIASVMDLMKGSGGAAMMQLMAQQQQGGAQGGPPQGGNPAAALQGAQPGQPPQ